MNFYAWLGAVAVIAMVAILLFKAIRHLPTAIQFAAEVILVLGTGIAIAAVSYYFIGDWPSYGGQGLGL